MAESFGTKTLREIAGVVFARFGMVVLIMLAITAAVYIACVRAPRHYKSSVTFLVKEPRPQNPTAQQVSNDRSLEVFVKTQQELIESPTVLGRTLLALKSPEAPVVKAWAEAEKAWELDHSAATWQALDASLTAMDAEVEKLKEDRGKGEEFRESIRRFAKRVKVETPGGEDSTLSEVFTISVVMPEPPETAQRAADLLAAHYKDRYRQVQVQVTRDAAEFVQTRLKAIEEERLVPAERALREFVARELKSPGDLVILEQLTRSGTEAGRQIIVRRFQEEIIELDAELAEARQLRQQLLEQLPETIWGDQPRFDDQQNLTIPDVAMLSEDRMPDNHVVLTGTVTIIPENTLESNVVVHQLKSKEVELLIDLNRLKVEYNGSYRGISDKMIEIAKARRQILKELIGEASALDIKVAGMEARRADIHRSLSAEQVRLDEITTKLVRYQELQHEVSLAREQHRRMWADLTDAVNLREQEAGAATIQIVDHARLADVRRPAFPNTMLYTIVAAFVGLLLAISYAFVAGSFDHTLKSIEETERYLDVPVIGSVGRHYHGLVNT